MNAHADRIDLPKRSQHRDVSRTSSSDVEGPFDGELLDLYVAILIVVPLALFLKSLWS